ncbi:MAG: TonB-dependent receptor [Ginsengibacter sp.]
MKLAVILFVGFCLQASASGYSQNVTVSGKNLSMEKVFSRIKVQTGYTFWYNVELVNKARKLDLDIRNTPLSEALEICFRNQPFSYEIIGKTIVVKQKALLPTEMLQKSETALPPPITVQGQVTNENGQPLAGVSVVVSGSNVGTSTDANGSYSIQAPNDGTLTFSFVGYASQSVNINSRTRIDIKLIRAESALSTVVVVGYGTQRKIDVTGSIASINGSDIANQPVTNPISGLQGKVAGVQITNSGAPGSSPDILIRGLGTFNAKTSPLYVVDGVWVDNIQFLNPSDIETVNILKDASSQAIFGVKGANGVVLITTKKGNRAKTTINYNGTVGWQVANNIPKMANAHEYAIMFNELQRVNNGTTFLDSTQFGEGTNWFNQALQNGIITNHQVSVNGGSDKGSYYLSLGYLDQQGILKTNDYKRYTSSFRNDIRATNNITVGYTLIGEYSKANNPPGGIWRQLYTAPSVLPVRFADGTYGDPGYYGLGSSVSNPQVTLDYNNASTQGYHLNGSVYADIKILKNFTWHSDFGGLYDATEFKNFTPVFKANSNQQSTHNTLTLNTTSQKNWLLNNTLTYRNTFGDHYVTVLLGQSAQRNYGYNTNGTAQDGSLSSNPRTWYLALGNGGGTVNDVPSLEKVSSYFGRVTYSYRDRYTLTGTLRSDASSLFTVNSGRATLPSIGAAWNISNESFMENQNKIQALKLKASWGVIGNSGVPLQASVAQTDANNIILGNNGVLLAGQSVSKPIPPPLNWEKSQGYDIGLEATLLNNKLNIEADYYNKETRNFIFALFLPGSNGYSTSYILENIGGVRNSGFELSLNYSDKVGSAFSYSVGANVSYNQNDFYENKFGGNQKFYSGGAASTGGQLGTITTLGQPIGVFYGYKVVGIFQSQADVNNYTDPKGNIYQPNAQPGDFKFAKLSNDGIGAINAQDRTVIGNPNPKWMYGINSSFGYKEFDLSLGFYGIAGVQLYNANKGLRYGNENFTQDFYDSRWHGNGTSNTDPSVRLGGGQNYYINSWYVENGSFFRIRNVQLGYTLRSSSLEKLGVEKLRLYINSQNPLIFTKYTGFSPELSGGTPGNRGIDNNVYPLYATYNFGVNLTF